MTVDVKFWPVTAKSERSKFQLPKTKRNFVSAGHETSAAIFFKISIIHGAPIKFQLRNVGQFGKGTFIALTPAHWVNLVPSALSPYFLLLKGNTNILCKATEIFQLIDRSAVNMRERQA